MIIDRLVKKIYSPIMNISYIKNQLMLNFFFLREFQLMRSTSDDSSLLSDQDIN